MMKNDEKRAHLGFSRKRFIGLGQFWKFKCTKHSSRDGRSFPVRIDTDLELWSDEELTLECSSFGSYGFSRKPLDRLGRFFAWRQRTMRGIFRIRRFTSRLPGHARTCPIWPDLARFGPKIMKNHEKS